jgi:hypothetical protein
MPDTTPSNFLKPLDRDALIHAALIRDTEEIDRITDELARQGVCRPRDDMSRMAEWIERRGLQAPALEISDAPIIKVAAESDIGATMAAHFRGIFAGAQQ